MKTKFYWLALLASAALIAPAQGGGGHFGGGGGGGRSGGGGGGRSGGGGGHFGGGGARFSGGGGHFGGGPSFHSANFGGGGRFAAPGPRFSAMGGRSSFRQHSISGGAPIGTRRFTSGDFNGGNRVTRFADRANRPGRIANSTGIQNQAGTRFGNNRHDRLGQTGNRVGERNGAVRNRDGQVRNGNNLPANWRNHISGQRSANWHRDWDRNRDHFWNGHRCRFVDGSWFIFDFGFPWYPYGYPYDYYADDYYPYQYDGGVYEGDYYGQGAYDSSDEYAGSTVSAAQAQLSSQGYYQGRIDGVYGAGTRRAVMRYQSDHGLRVTGSLSTDTLDALGLPRVANN
jgi:Putative peptidoglycan binding domain